MTIVAFGSDVIDIFEVNDIMSSKGWHLNALQRPNRWEFLLCEEMLGMQCIFFSSVDSLSGLPPTSERRVDIVFLYSSFMTSKFK